MKKITACLSLGWVVSALAGPAVAAPPAPPEAESEAPAAEVALAQPPVLKQLIAAELPQDTKFPAPVVPVMLEIEVGADGRVVDVAIASGPGAPFDAAAVAAARRFEFEPARLTTGATVPVTVTFELRVEAPPPPPPPPVQYVGTLLERGTRKPIAGVAVAARAADAVLVDGETDARGRFTLTVPAADFRLVALPLRHEKLSQPIQARPGERIEARFFLESVGGKNETIVRAQRVRHEVTKRVIPKDVVTTAVGTAGDTIKVVQNLPGVARATFGGGELVLRGSSPEDSRVLLDGHLIPMAYHFGGLRASFNSAFLDALDFVPGNFGPEYGDATGGIVDIKTRDPAADMFRGNVDINVYDAGFVLEGPVTDGLTMGGAFHRSYIDTLLPLFIPDDTPLTFDTLPRYYDYQFITSYKPNDAHTLKLIWFGSNDKLRVVLDDPAVDDPALRDAIATELMFHGVLLSHRWKINPRLRQDLSIQYLWNDMYVQVGPGAFVDNSAHVVSLRGTWTWQALDWLDVRWGLDGNAAEAYVSLLVPNPPKEGHPPGSFSSMEKLRFENTEHPYNPGGFVELAVRPVESLTLLPSLRVDYHADVESWTFSPRLAARWEVTDGTRITGGVGLYQQQPTGDETLPVFGTPELLPERALQVSLGVEQRLLDEGLTVELTGFYKDLDRLVTPNPRAGWTPDEPRYTNLGSGTIYGLELLLKADFDGIFDGWIAYTLQRSLRTDGPGMNERPFDWDQPHILTVLGRAQIGAGWSAALRFRLVSGNPTTPVTGSVLDTTTDTYVPFYGEVNSDRMELFHQLDLRIDKTFTFDTWKLTTYVEVQNVYYHGNQEGVSWNYDFSKTTQVTGLPILPILGVKGEW